MTVYAKISPRTSTPPEVPVNCSYRSDSVPPLDACWVGLVIDRSEDTPVMPTPLRNQAVIDCGESNSLDCTGPASR